MNSWIVQLSKVASVNIQTGIMWSDIRIDSTGGSNPIVSHGHSKEDARTIRDLIERLQQTMPESEERNVEKALDNCRKKVY